MTFNEFVKEGIVLRDKKWIPPEIDGIKIDYNNTSEHAFKDRIDKIENSYILSKELQKEKHEWLRELSRKDLIINLQERVKSAIMKLKDKGTKDGKMFTVYFKKSKFIALILVREKYIRLSTIGTYDYIIKKSLKMSINEINE